MLVVVMHNNQLYLEFLMQLAKKEKISQANIMQQENIGSSLIGGNANFIYSRGKMLNVYNKAFVATVEGEDRAKKFLESIEKDTVLEKLNINDKGFVCTVPFACIRESGFQSVKKEEDVEQMKVTNFLIEEKILLNAESRHKESAIKEVAYLLKDSKKIVDYEKFLEDIFERESLNSTGIGNSIAIPHARTNAVGDFVMAYGCYPDGLEFNALDNKPVKFVFLMGTPVQKGLNEYLKILAYLTRLLNKKDFQTELLSAKNPKEAIDIFRKVEVKAG